MCLKTILEYIAKCIAKLLLILFVLLSAMTSGVSIAFLANASQDDTEEVQWIPLVSLGISFSLVVGALSFVVAHKLWPSSKKKQPILPLHHLPHQPGSSSQGVITDQLASIEIEMSEISPLLPTSPKGSKKETTENKKAAEKQVVSKTSASSSLSPKRASEGKRKRDKKDTPRKESVSVKTSKLPPFPTHNANSPTSLEGKKKTGKLRVHWALAASPRKETTKEQPVAIEMSEIKSSSPILPKDARQKTRVAKKEAEKQVASETPVINSPSSEGVSKGKTKRRKKATPRKEPVAANTAMLPSASSQDAISHASSADKKQTKEKPVRKGASNVTYLAFTSLGKEKLPEFKPEEKREEISPAEMSVLRRSW